MPHFRKDWGAGQARWRWHRRWQRQTAVFRAGSSGILDIRAWCLSAPGLRIDGDSLGRRIRRWAWFDSERLAIIDRSRPCVDDLPQWRGGCGSHRSDWIMVEPDRPGVVKMDIEHLQTSQGRLGIDGATGPGFDRPTIPRCAALWFFWPYSGCRVPVFRFDNFGLRWIFKVLW